MDSAEYMSFDATGLAELVVQRHVLPGELLDAALKRQAEVNPAVNAVVRTLEGQARAAITDGLPDGPFKGVPFLAKDITTHMKGVVTSAGSRLMKDNVATADTALIAAYRKAGFNIYGKTNTPEFGLLGITEPNLWGATRNPWNLSITPGGSSGGSAAAVAAGIVPVAGGGDGGGSIRIPASACGLFGFKPSRGRVSMAPQGEGWGGLTVLHTLTRSVRDSAATLDVACLPQPGDIYWHEPPQTPYAEHAKRAPRQLRIGMLTTNLYGGPQDSEITDAVREAGKLCEELGHVVEETTPPTDIRDLIGAVTTVISAAVRHTIDSEIERRGRPLEPGEIEIPTQALYEAAKSQTSRDYVKALMTMHILARATAPFFARYDVMLLATLGRMPPRVGILQEYGFDLKVLQDKFYDYGPNTQLFNITGQPAMSVPLAWNSGGLPIGIQFAGCAADEATLFSLAGRLEEARPWFNRRPPEAPLRSGAR
jgi:amidase